MTFKSSSLFAQIYAARRASVNDKSHWQVVAVLDSEGQSDMQAIVEKSLVFDMLCHRLR